MRPKKSYRNVNDKAMIMNFEKLILQWICERHATNQPLNREILRDKIVDLSAELGLGSFDCSKSWITKFLKKHGFSSSLTSHQGPVFNDYRDWIDLMRSYITQYRYKNVFQVDEMGMYHNILPDDIPLSSDYLTCSNGEQRKNRLTILLCCNASGVEKLPPLICGEFENQLAANHNCQYYTNHNAWLAPDIFKLWLSQLNTQMLHSNRKILLLLNRTFIHRLKDAVLSNVNLMFFPKEFPTNLQPLKANIFHYVKMIYRKNYTNRMIKSNSNWTMVDTINGIVESWDSVPKEFILSSFRRTNIRSDNDLLQISCPDWENLNQNIPFRRYVTFDDDLCVSLSPTRRSKRLAEIKTAGSSGTSFFQGSSYNGSYHKPIELGDSDSDEIIVEEISHSSQIRKFSHDFLPSENSTRKNDRQIDKARHSDTVMRDSNDDNNFTYLDRPIAETTILYESDIAKNAVKKVLEYIPDMVEMSSGLEGHASTVDVINRCEVVKNTEVASISRKRLREEIDIENVPNDESMKRTEKKIVGEQVWSDIYEHNFVFGVTESSQSTTSASAEFQRVLQHPIQKNDDLEKKSIFTISHASSSTGQNQ